MGDILKIESKETLSREEAAARLHAIADGLASHNDVELDWGGKHIKVHVADEVRLELEIEVGDDETEFEIELKWRRPNRARAGRRGPPAPEGNTRCHDRVLRIRPSSGPRPCASCARAGRRSPSSRVSWGSPRRRSAGGGSRPATTSRRPRARSTTRERTDP